MFKMHINTYYVVYINKNKDCNLCSNSLVGYSEGTKLLFILLQKEFNLQRHLQYLFDYSRLYILAKYLLCLLIIKCIYDIYVYIQNISVKTILNIHLYLQILNESHLRPVK